jgi:uncharacterized membrane protein YraQ (UPF0718 family)/YHS domain-containing protein
VLVHVIDLIGSGLEAGMAMLWATFWALVLGFALSGAVQAFVSRDQMRHLLGDRTPLSLLRATGFGAASSSCSYAASAMAKSLFSRGADFVAAMVFMFASTNLVVELGVVLAVLIGWQFTVGEFFGGLVMIALLVLVARVTIPERLVAAARDRLQLSELALHPDQGTPGPKEGTSTSSWRQQLGNRQAWIEAASYAVADIKMLRRELAIGFLAAGFLSALVPAAFWQALFLPGHGFWSALENSLIGPAIAMVSFVCSVGNVPLAAALWKGGISFGGVISFIFADLITFPLLLIYGKFYGSRLTLRMLGSFWLVMSTAGLATQYLFTWLHLVPGTRPGAVVPSAFTWSYTSWLDLLALVLVVAIFLAATTHHEGAGRGSTADPVCGMRVEVGNAPASDLFFGRRYYFCSDRCLQRFQAEPERFAGGPGPQNPAQVVEVYAEAGTLPRQPEDGGQSDVTKAGPPPAELPGRGEP